MDTAPPPDDVNEALPETESQAPSAPQQAKKGRKKRSKNKQRKQEEDEDFDAILREYGAPQVKEERDPVMRIMNGTLKVGIPHGSTSKKPSAAQQKLSMKLAEAAKARSKKNTSKK